MRAYLRLFLKITHAHHVSVVVLIMLARQKQHLAHGTTVLMLCEAANVSPLVGFNKDISFYL